jgi:hypothetical protein
VGGLSTLSRGADGAALALHDRIYELCSLILDSPDDAEAATDEALHQAPRRASEHDLLRSALETCRRARWEPEREALALRELEGLSFGEIADLVGVEPDEAALLIVWARVPAATLFASAACERALPLIAREQDGLLDQNTNKAGWLEEHLMRCRGCRVRRDALQPSGAEEPERRLPAPTPRAPRPRRFWGEAALAGVLGCVFLLVLLFGPASYNEMLGSPFPKAAEDQWRVPSVPSTSAAPPPADPRPAEGKRGGGHGVVKRGDGVVKRRKPKERVRRGERGRPRPAGRAVRRKRRRAAEPPAVRPVKKPKQQAVPRGRVERHEEPAPQDNLVPEAVAPAPAPPPEAPPTATAPEPQPG